MKSQIDEKLSEKEKALFNILMSEKVNLKGGIRIALQYILAASIFVFLTIYDNQPLYSIGIFVILVIVAIMPLIKAMQAKKEIPELIKKYDNEIEELKRK